ncbi:MAG: class I SAM-dependent methyltransferase [Candidatus Sumerlaeaceae bacterium]
MGANSIGAFIRITTLRRRLAELLPPNCERVFEAGCGTAAVLAQLRPFFPGAALSGIDIDPDLIRRAQERIPEGKFWVADLTQFTGSANQDLVLNVDVLEHIEDYQAALRGMLSCLKPGGLLALHTPNETQRRLLPVRLLQEHHQHDHVREGYNLDTLASDMEALGAEVLHKERTVGTFGALLWDIDFIARKAYPMNLLLLPVLKLFARVDIGSCHPQGNGLLIIAKKKGA